MNAAKSSRPLVLLLIGALISAAAVFGFALQTQTTGAKAALAPPTIRFPGRTGATFQCQLVVYEFATCTTPRSYSALTQGAQTFSVRLVSDRLGLVDRQHTAPSAPLLTQWPSDPTADSTITFAWESDPVALFQCSLENSAWSTCPAADDPAKNPHIYTYVIGTTNNQQHQFAVRAVDAAGNASAATSYSFKYEKRPFSITGTVGALSIGVPQPITVTLRNPNRVAIYVTAVTVSVAVDSSPIGCTSARNIELVQSNISTDTRVLVPANGTALLTAHGASTPVIRLKNLDVNQNVCKNVSFALTYSGTATN